MHASNMVILSPVVPKILCPASRLTDINHYARLHTGEEERGSLVPPGGYLIVPSRAGAKGFPVLDWLKCKNNYPSGPHLLPLILLLLLRFTFCFFFIFFFFCFHLSTVSSFSVSSFLFFYSLPSFLNVCFFFWLQSPAGQHFWLWFSWVLGILFVIRGNQQLSLFSSASHPQSWAKV